MEHTAQNYAFSSIYCYVLTIERILQHKTKILAKKIEEKE